MFLDPSLPGRHAFAFLRAAIAFGKGVPGHSSRTGFAAKEHCEIGIVRAHNVSFLLRLRVGTPTRYNDASDRCSRLRSARPTLAEFCARAVPMTPMPSAHRNIHRRYNLGN